MPRSASNSSTSRYDKEKRRYQPTARRITSGSNCLHLNRPETDDARSIGPAYQTTPAKLQHCPPAKVQAIISRVIRRAKQADDTSDLIWPVYLSRCVAAISRTATCCIGRDAVGDCYLPYPRLLALGIEQIGHGLTEPALLCSFHCHLFRDHLSV